MNKILCILYCTYYLMKQKMRKKTWKTLQKTLIYTRRNEMISWNWLRWWYCVVESPECKYYGYPCTKRIMKLCSWMWRHLPMVIVCSLTIRGETKRVTESSRSRCLLNPRGHTSSQIVAFLDFVPLFGFRDTIEVKPTPILLLPLKRKANTFARYLLMTGSLV